MQFRLTAFALHLLSSASVLTIVVGVLFLGWYRWPGWYLADVFTVIGVLAGVDVALGPSLTFIVASPRKTRRQLTFDIGIIVAVQLVALIYGSATLWTGRPVYYTFSLDRLELVRAFEIEDPEVELARAQNPQFAPHWYRRPSWVWAQLPSDEKTASAIVQSAVTGGADVVDMPRYFKPWAEGLPELRKQLKSVDKLTNLTVMQKAQMQAHMRELGYPPEQAITMLMTGRGDPLVAVFDPVTVRMRALLRLD